MSVLVRTSHRIAPEAGAAVMATGIVSVLARSHGFVSASRPLLAVTDAQGNTTTLVLRG